MATSLLVSNYSSATYDYGYNGTLLAQVVTIPSGYDRVDYVKLYLKRIGSVSGNVTVSIYRTSGGYPTGSAIASATYSANSISTGGQVVTFDMSDVTVSAGEKVAIVMANGGTSGSNVIAWYCTYTNPYSGGDSFYKLTSGGWVANGYDMWFELYGYQSATAPTGVTTGAVSSITTTTASVAIDVTTDGGSAITERGAVYSSTNPTPTTGDSKKTTTGTTGAGSVSLTGLSAGTRYYVRAYATNAIGTTYGDVVEFTTSTTTPTVTTSAPTGISSTTATGSGNVTDAGGTTVTERGVCWNTSTTPTTANSKASSGTGTGAFTVSMAGLAPNTTYYARAYAINANGTSYGAEFSFTTLDTVKYWAQSFSAPVTGTLTKVSLYLKLAVGLSGMLKVRIYSDNAGSPNALLATANTVTVTNTGLAWVDVPINVALTSGTTYWIVIEDIYAIGSYHIWLGTNSAGGYASGAVKYSKSSAIGTWINTSYTTHDFTFRTYVQPTVTATYTLEIKAKKYYKG